MALKWPQDNGTTQQPTKNTRARLGYEARLSGNAGGLVGKSSGIPVSGLFLRHFTDLFSDSDRKVLSCHFINFPIPIPAINFPIFFSRKTVPAFFSTKWERRRHRPTKWKAVRCFYFFSSCWGWNTFFAGCWGWGITILKYLLYLGKASEIANSSRSLST